MIMNTRDNTFVNVLSIKGLKIAEKRHMLKIHVPVCKQSNGTYYLNLFSDKVNCFKYIHIFQVLW